MADVETVETVHDTIDRTLRVRYVRNASTNEKAPTHNALVWMPAPLDEVVSTFPIFKSAKDGSYSVTLPGNKGFPAFKPANMIHADGSLLADLSALGKGNLDRLQQAIFAGFLEYRRTGNADQIVSI